MEKHTQLSVKRRVGVVLAGVLASAAIASTVATSAVSASTELAVTVAPEYGLNKVATRLSIVDTVGIVSRLPQTMATPEEAATLNKTAPKLTCEGAAGTVSSTGEYGSDNGVLTIIFVFDKTPTVDKCTLSNTTYVRATGDTVYPLTAAAKAAYFGDPVKILEAANARLKSALPALRRSYQGSWRVGAVARLDKALTKYSVQYAMFGFEASSTATNVMYVVRPDEHRGDWVNLCQRLTDGRLACLRYNAVKNTTKLWVNYESPNFYLETATHIPEAAA